MTHLSPVLPSDGPLRPLGLDEVRLTGGFWAHRQHVNATATLAHCLERAEAAGWVGNFRLVAGYGAAPATARQGREFSDSEVYKLLEAYLWEAARRPDDASLTATVDVLTATIAAAQEPDGYLNTAFGRPGQPARYSDLAWGHELYCYGHLIQAGVAQLRTTGEGSLARVAVRAADHVCDLFGPNGRDAVCGHAEIETALAELGRATGEHRYLDQAALFVARRGHGTLPDGEFGRAYHQDDLPVREAHTLRGHAVRALYLASGAVDVAVDTKDAELLAAVEAQWEHAVGRRTHLTGGMGAHHQDEAFGADWELPPDRAYSETCAGVASVHLAWRLLLATGRPRYADLAERTLFNVIAASPAADGRSFFYANTLHRRERGAPVAPGSASLRAASALRAPWFAVSCCPTNLARMFASLAGYIATVDADGLQIHQYADAEIKTELPDQSGDVALRVRTGYPYDGVVVIHVDRAPGAAWTLSLRVPGWAGDGARLTGPDGVRRDVAAGTALVRHAFRAGDTVRLDLPVEPRWTYPDPRVDALRGTVAVERGPLVLCVESPDLPDEVDVDAVQVDPARAPVDTGADVRVRGALLPPPDSCSYHRAPAPTAAAPADITLVPYHTWAERGPSTMRVWLPVQTDTGHTTGSQPGEDRYQHRDQGRDTDTAAPLGPRPPSPR